MSKWRHSIMKNSQKMLEKGQKRPFWFRSGSGSVLTFRFGSSVPAFGFGSVRFIANPTVRCYVCKQNPRFWTERSSHFFHHMIKALCKARWLLRRGFLFLVTNQNATLQLTLSEWKQQLVYFNKCLHNTIYS